MTRQNPALIVALLHEAIRLFGAITPENKTEVTAWVMREAQHREDRDHKAAAAGNDK